MVSLGWVSPETAAEGVTPSFYWNKLATFFSHHRRPILRCHPYLFHPGKLTTFFAHHCHFYWFHSGVTPLEGVTRTFFYPSDHYFFVNLPTTNFSFGCHPLGGCHPGRSAPPPCDATVYSLSVIVYCLHIVKCVRLTYINKTLLICLLRLNNDGRDDISARVQWADCSLHYTLVLNMLKIWRRAPRSWWSQ